MVGFYNYDGYYYPKVTVKKYSNSKFTVVNTSNVNIDQNEDLYVYVDLSDMTEFEYLNELMVYVLLGSNTESGELRLKKIISSGTDETKYNSTDRGDITAPYQSSVITKKVELLKFNITQLASSQLTQSSKIVKFRLKYYGSGYISIQNKLNLITGSLSIYQNIITPKTIEGDTNILYDNNQSRFHIIKPYQFNYSGIVLQNNIRFSYNKNQSPLSSNLFTCNFSFEKLNDNKYLYTNELGQYFIYYSRKSYEDEYYCYQNNSQLIIKDDHMELIINGCTYEINNSGYITRVYKGAKCLLYNYSSGKLISISKGKIDNEKLTINETLSEFITFNDNYILCEDEKKKFIITENIVSSTEKNIKIEEIDIDSKNNVTNKKYSLELQLHNNYIDDIIINECEYYDFNTNDNDDFIITNNINQLTYTYGITNKYYYINDNYNNSEKYYYNTKNEVLYVVKEKNGKIFEKKCISYKNNTQKEQEDLFVKNLLTNTNFDNFTKEVIRDDGTITNNNELSGIHDGQCTNTDKFIGLSDQQYMFHPSTIFKKRRIHNDLNISGKMNEIITLTLLSKINVETNEFLKIDFIVTYKTNNGLSDEKYTKYIKSNHNDYEFNTIKFVTKYNYTNIKLIITYSGENLATISNIMVYKSVSNNQIICDNANRVIGVSNNDFSIISDEHIYGNSKYTTYKDVCGRYIESIYSNDNLVSEENYSNSDYVICDYDENNLLVNKTSKNDDFISNEKYVYDELENITEATVDEETNYYFNKIEQNKITQQCIDSTGLLTKDIKQTYSLSNKKLTKHFQLNDLHEKNTFHYEDGLLQKIESFDDKIYTFQYDSKKRIATIYIDGKLYIHYEYSNEGIDVIKKKQYANNNIIKFDYDNSGRLSTVYKTNLSESSSKTLAIYEYDGLNRIKNIKSLENNITKIEKTFEYDDLGNVIECVSPTHTSSYIYNDDKELTHIKTKYSNDDIVYNSIIANKEVSIESFFQELTDNIYCDYYFPNKFCETFSGNEDFDSVYENIVYDNNLKRNISLCTEEFGYFPLRDNYKIKENGSVYNNKIFEESVYKENIRKLYGIMGIFKFENVIYPEKILYKLSLDLDDTAYELYLILTSDRNIKLTIKQYYNFEVVRSYDLLSDFYIDKTNWHMIGLINDVENAKVGILYDDTIKWFENDTPINYELIYCHPTVHGIDMNAYKRAFLMYGHLNIKEKQLERLYIDFSKIFNSGKNYELITSNTYDVFDTSNLDKVSFNKSFTSYKGLYPDVIYINENCNNNPKKLFKFDEQLNKYCYESTSLNESYLKYIFSQSLNKTLISMKFKILNITHEKENTLFTILNQETEKIKVTHIYDTINVYIDEQKKTFNFDKINLNNFNYIRLFVLNNYITLVINDSQDTKYYAISNTGINELDLIVGNDNSNNAFEGLISDLIIGNVDEDINTNLSSTQFITKSDSQGRIRSKSINANQNEIKTHYSYYDKQNDDGTKKLNTLINRIKNYDGSEEIISYDDNNSIIKRVLIKDDLVIKITNYKYDNFNRLLEEVRFELENNSLSETYKGIFEYDDYGNLVRNKTYYYEQLSKDLKFIYQSNSRHTLVKVINQCNNSEYSIQNLNSAYPSKIGTKNIVYEGSKIVQYGNNYYTYDALGKRIKKITEDNKIYNYIYDNDNLVRQISNNITIDYIYNNTLLEGLRYNNEEYYYVRDITGCIEKIIDKNKKEMVLYRYTSYGEVEAYINPSLTSSEIEIANVLMNNNGFVYKGYYYDVKTGLFWISSRYYNPEWGRWISPDDIEYLDPESVNGLNLYCYCGNDPINLCDPSGHVAVSALIGLVIGLVVELSVDYLEDDSRTLDHSFWEYVGAGVGGAISGGFGATKNVLLRFGGAVLGSVAQGVISENVDYSFERFKKDLFAGVVAFGISEGITILGKTVLRNWTNKSLIGAPKEASKQIKQLSRGWQVKNMKPYTKTILKIANRYGRMFSFYDKFLGGVYSFVTDMSHNILTN